MIAHLKIDLKDEIKNIDAMLIAHLSVKIVISATSRCISLTNNHTKGSVGMIKARAEECYPRCLLQTSRVVVEYFLHALNMISLNFIKKISSLSNLS